MNLLWLLFSLFAVTNCNQGAKSDIVVLTKDSIEKFLKDNKVSLVEFYAPWCPFYQALAPEYETAATELKPHNIRIAKIDCTVEVQVCLDQQIAGYPTLKLFRNGVTIEYKGMRTHESIVETLIRNARPALVPILDKEALEKAIGGNKVSVFGYFENISNSGFKTLDALAEKYRDEYSIYYTLDKNLIKDAKVSPPAIVAYTKFDEKKSIYSGKLEVEADIYDFIKSHSLPLIDDITPQNYIDYIGSGIPLAYLFYQDEGMKKSLKETCDAFTTKHRGKIAFVLIDGNRYSGHARALGLEEVYPAVVIQHPTTKSKYPFDRTLGFDGKALGSFFSDFVGGKLTPYLKSEEVPAKNVGAITTVVASEFDKIVFDKTKDVLLNIYAPWCGHCQTLSPIWDELGEFLKRSKVVVAQMDGTLNDLPEDAGFVIEGFPTVKLFRARDNKVIDYQGARTVNDFVQFMKENNVNGLFTGAYDFSNKIKDKREEHEKKLMKEGVVPTKQPMDKLRDFSHYFTDHDEL